MRQIYILSIGLFFLFGCATTNTPKVQYDKRKCPDGRIVFIPKYDPFAFFDTERESTLKLLTKISSDKSIEINAEDSNQIAYLVEKFDQITSTLLINAKLSFETFKLFACDKDQQDEYLTILKDLNKSQSEIQSLRIKVDAIINKGQLGGSNIEDIIVFLKDFINKVDHED